MIQVHIEWTEEDEKTSKMLEEVFKELDEEQKDWWLV